MEYLLKLGIILQRLLIFEEEEHLAQWGLVAQSVRVTLLEYGCACLHCSTLSWHEEAWSVSDLPSTVVLQSSYSQMKVIIIQPSLQWLHCILVLYPFQFHQVDLGVRPLQHVTAPDAWAHCTCISDVVGFKCNSPTACCHSPHTAWTWCHCWGLWQAVLASVIWWW